MIGTTGAALEAVEHIVRQRRPSRWEAAVVGTAAVFRASLRRSLWSTRAVVLTFVLLLPAGLALVGLLANRDRQVTVDMCLRVETVILLSILPTALVPFCALFFASGAIQDEVEDQTLTYLFVRPCPRWAIYAAKLAAVLVSTVALTTLALAIGYAVVYWRSPDGLVPSILPMRAMKTAGVAALACVAYVALFGLIGLLTKRSLVVGIIYIIAVEAILASIPFNFRSYTVVYYFRTLVIRLLDLKAEWGMDKLGELPTTQSSVLTLLGIGLATLGIGGWIVQTREFRLKTPAGN